MGAIGRAETGTEGMAKTSIEGTVETSIEGMVESGAVSVAGGVAMGIPTSTVAPGSLGVFAIKENGHSKQRETAAEGLHK